ncbi:MAG: hypothetical protein COZ24_11700 [Hydrogenophilales bacterium CG_4_10_14_3_um_filter_63_21]|nr:MAG: hypothetical protein COZ24_11700 [Hydrogenophilales bacterium CG_4_10_14_3_um_filter_63_21]
MRALLMILVLLAAPLPSAAVGPNPASPRAFSVHDQDHDGYLSREEYAALRAQCQERRDSRGRPRCDPRRLLEFDDLDSNRDGRIGEGELVETLARRYRGGGFGWRGEGR